MTGGRDVFPELRKKRSLASGERRQDVHHVVRF